MKILMPKPRNNNRSPYRKLVKELDLVIGGVKPDLKRLEMLRRRVMNQPKPLTYKQSVILWEKSMLAMEANEKRKLK